MHTRFLLIAMLCAGKISAQDIPTLKNVFKQDFLIGAAVNSRQVEEKDSATSRLIRAQFNTVTPENVMKAEAIHPGWNKYNYTEADQLVAYAAKHHMKVNAHNLIWHSQLPNYVHRIKDKDSLRTWFTTHINTIASRYDGKVYSWDVVNEALNEDGSMRKSIFLDMLGSDFVTEAFRLAQKASPHSKLYYNDYNIEEPAKRAGAIALIKKIQAAGVRIDGVGIQGHWHAGRVPLKEIEESIRAFAALGIEVMITELDLSVLPNPEGHAGADVNKTAGYDPTMNPYVKGLPDSVSDQLAKDYTDLFRLFIRYKKQITRVTFWGVEDGGSWLNGWPIPGRTNYPLLFDRQLKPKKAFYNVVALADHQ